MPTARLNGVDLYYETSGVGERLVLTHGSWTDGSGWVPVVGALAERFEVLTWDRRGHSRSQAGDGPAAATRTLLTWQRSSSTSAVDQYTWSATPTGRSSC